MTVVLTGEGADELFCGYPRYHLARLTGSVRHLPRWTTTAAAQVVGALPGHRAALAGRLLRRSFEDSVLFNSAYVDPDLVAALTRRPVASAIAERRTLLRESTAASPRSRA